MTKKHFKAIAEILKVHRLAALDVYDYGPTNPIDRIIDELGTYFKTQNHRFDRAQFNRAAGMEE